MHKLDVRYYLDNVSPREDAEQPACERCNGVGMVYEPRPVFMGSRVVGTIEDLVPCPVCSGVCPTCEGKGVVGRVLPPDDPRFGRLFPCPDCDEGRKLKQNMQMALLTTVELPKQYKHMTFRSWDRLPKSLREGKRLARAAAGLFVEAAETEFFVTLSSIYEACGLTLPDGVADVARNSLVLQGPVGMGKTGLAAAIVNALAQRFEHKLLYIRVRELIERVQRTYGKDYEGPGADEVLGELMRVPIIVLDEFSVTHERGKASENKQDIIETLIRHRYNNLLPTILTLNPNRDEMESEWGIRTATAVRAMAHWIPLGGKPLRNEGFEIVEAI